MTELSTRQSDHPASLFARYYATSRNHLQKYDVPRLLTPVNDGAPQSMDSATKGKSMLPRSLDTLIAHKVINLTPELSATEKRVAGAILEHFNRNTRRCDPSINRIARLLGVSRRTVLRAIHRLEKLGLFRKRRHGGHFHCNSYEPVWTRFYELDAEWKIRFRADSVRSKTTEVSPSLCQTFPLRGDGTGTQTLRTNPSKETCSTEAAPIGFAPPNKPEGCKGHSGQVIGQTLQHIDSSVPGETSRRQNEAARAAAERRWNAALLDRYAATPTLHSEIIDAINPAMQAGATTAELGEPGAGLAYILAQLQERKVRIVVETKASGGAGALQETRNPKAGG
jgi:DNA-binding transcriptional ArsR family regulator